MSSKNKNLLLDADSSIMENKLRFVKNELEEEFNNLFDPQTAETKSKQDYIITKPVPGFCVKTHITYDNRKLFINVCQTPDIPAPQDISEEELHTLLISEKPSAFKVPLSISEIRQINDRSGLMAKSCDIAINPNFFEKIQTISLFRHFFLTIVFEAIEEKFGVHIDISNWIILKNKKCMGGLTTHRIEKRNVNRSAQEKIEQNKTSIGTKIQEVSNAGKINKNKKIIEEIDEETLMIAKKNMKNNSKSNDNILQNISTKTPQYNLMKENLPDNKSRLIAEFHLPECISANEITVDVGEDRVLLEARKRGYLFDSFVDYVIDQKNTQAEFMTSTGILTINMPILQENKLTNLSKNNEKS